MAKDNTVLDPNGLVSEFHSDAHDGTIHHRITQPNEALILERNKRLRNEPEAFKKNDFMAPLCTIPVSTWEWAKRNGYDLDCQDREIADKELFRFLKSPEGKACLMTEKY